MEKNDPAMDSLANVERPSGEEWRVERETDGGGYNVERRERGRETGRERDRERGLPLSHSVTL